MVQHRQKRKFNFQNHIRQQQEKSQEATTPEGRFLRIISQEPISDRNEPTSSLPFFSRTTPLNQPKTPTREQETKI